MCSYFRDEVKILSLLLEDCTGTLSWLLWFLIAFKTCFWCCLFSSSSSLFHVPGDGVIVNCSSCDPGVPKSQKRIALENPGNTWNSRSKSPKLLQVPRHQIYSFTFSFIIFVNTKKESLNISNSVWPSTIASTNLLWPRGCDLSACWLQTDTWNENTVREASVCWKLRPKTPSGKAVKSPLLLLSKPKAL